MTDLVPSNRTGDSRADEIIRVVGVSTTVASFIVSQLAKYTTDVLVAGVESILISIDRSRMTIRYARRNAQGEYTIAIKSDLAQRFSAAIDRAESNAYLRPEIKAKLIQELKGDLDEIFAQLKQELRQF